MESIERVSLRWAFHAAVDFSTDAYEIFRDSPDEAKDIAEDITRDMFDRLSMCNTPQRVLGTVDYKKARYVVLPEHATRQALFADSKAERTANSLTIQMSQTSLNVLQERAGDTTDVAGHLPKELVIGSCHYLTSTIFAHFHYREVESGRQLRAIRLCALPNGHLQEKYNPGPDESIWLAGRDAPTLGEAFRVRISFKKLRSKAPWRVQVIEYDDRGRIQKPRWQEDLT
ncbi:MAG: SfiI family type II restriction endonuclease [Phycisphaeraceae bacterium]